MSDTDQLLFHAAQTPRNSNDPCQQLRVFMPALALKHREKVATSVSAIYTSQKNATVVHTRIRAEKRILGAMVHLGCVSIFHAQHRFLRSEPKNLSTGFLSRLEMEVNSKPKTWLLGDSVTMEGCAALIWFLTGLRKVAQGSHSMGRIVTKVRCMSGGFKGGWGEW